MQSVSMSGSQRVTRISLGGSHRIAISTKLEGGEALLGRRARKGSRGGVGHKGVKVGTGCRDLHESSDGGYRMESGEH